jgi:uncharacterized protein YkuJ
MLIKQKGHDVCNGDYDEREGHDVCNGDYYEREGHDVCNGDYIMNDDTTYVMKQNQLVMLCQKYQSVVIF